jgi:hypothetical protein
MRHPVRQEFNKERREIQIAKLVAAVSQMSLLLPPHTTVLDTVFSFIMAIILASCHYASREILSSKSKIISLVYNGVLMQMF